MDPDLSRATRALTRLRDELALRHRYCVLEVSLHADAASRHVTLRGEVLVDRLREAAAACVSAELPQGWSTIDELRVVQTDRWIRLAGPRWLLASPESTAARVVEVLPEAGPLQVLTRLAGEPLNADQDGGGQGVSFVRAPDGTVGWMQTSAVSTGEAPRLPLPKTDDGSTVVEAARQQLGIPYVLGGTSGKGIDCSGLVQRAVHSGLGVLVPRHSSDQLALGALPGPPPPGCGHLVFVWSDAEAAHHVGVSGESTVVHASLSRRRVVEDTKAQLWDGAPRVEHVPLHRLLALGRRCAGFPNLLAAGLVLGGTS